MASDAPPAQKVLDALKAMPAGERTRTFNEPWEAQAFAIAVALQWRGLFTREEWAVALGEEIRNAQARGDPDTGDTYYRHWLAAIERLVQEKGIASGETLIGCREAWQRAADRTPHGDAIVLAPQDWS
ncbi:MAG: nitrile hydratase accessory protein [Betaproteobacteria bacterium]